MPSRPVSRPISALSKPGLAQRLRPSTDRPNSNSRPRTAASTTGGGSSSDDPCWIVAVVEGRGVAPEIAVAALDLRTSKCELCQSYSKLINKLYIYDPIEILLPITVCEPNPSKLALAIADSIPEAELVPTGRKYFNDNNGLTTISNLSLPDSLPPLLHGLERKRFALSTLSALFTYLESGSAGVSIERLGAGKPKAKQGLSFARGSIRFEVVGVEGGMVVDATTARNLELVRNTGDVRAKSACLFGAIDKTCTPMGARLLRLTILQPLCQKTTLDARLDCVEELTADEETFFGVRKGLGELGVDVDHLITSIITTAPTARPSAMLASLNHTCQLARLLRRLPTISIALASCKVPTLRAVRVNLSDPELESIGQWINEVSNRTPLLDIARQTYQENVHDVFQLASTLSDTHGLPFKLLWADRTGFQLSVSREAVEASQNGLPAIFVNASWKKKTVVGTTVELKQRNERINDSLNEVWLMSDGIVRELLDKVRAKISILYSVAESLAVLDMLASFAAYCTTTDSVRPEFTDTLAIKAGRHPILDRINVDKYIANDAYASEGTNFQVLSQIGSFIPADYCSVRLADRLMSRLCGDNDDVEGNASTFLLEMREAAYIVENAGDSSVVIIDELGRGTSTYDGIGLTYAIAEELIKRKSFTFFATHFHTLVPALTGPYPTAVPLHLEVARCETVRNTDTGDCDARLTIKYTYTVRDGTGEEDGYGIRLAGMLGMPGGVTKYAKKIAGELRAKISAAALQNEATKANRRKKACLQLANALVQARRSSTLDEEGMRAYLTSLRDSFVAEVKRIEGIEDEEENGDGEEEEGYT
ncbi:MutS protein msh4 [Gonapodya sp. JEL0774]|nr:MutS protein msh4 [Gonapodya sp. JEL0774]